MTSASHSLFRVPPERERSRPASAYDQRIDLGEQIMATTLYAVPLLDTLARALSQAWARLGQRQFEPLARWQVLHIDQNGELQRATVDVLEAMPLERMILARCSPQDEPLAIQLGRIIEAIDVPTGRKVMLDRWMAYIEGQPGVTRPGGLEKAPTRH